MSTISATAYAPYYPTLNNSTAARTAAPTSTGTGGGSTSSSATNVTLSDAAKAALSEKDFATVVAETRAALDKLLADAKLNSPLKDGKSAVYLGSLDRQQVFAISSNASGKFTPDEQKAADLEATRRLDAALAGPLAVARVTGKIDGVYKAAIDYLDAASPEEKATQSWIDQKAALVEAQKQLADAPDDMPEVEGDIVARYVERANAGETGAPRDFTDVASDARAVLDQQYADAKAAGKELVFSKTRKTGQLVDFTKFDSRSLSSIALNQNGKFTDEEVFAASGEIRARSGATLLASFKDASKGSDPTAFSKNLISAYASMSPEERSAAGWSENFYNAALANYKSSSDIAQMFASAGISGGGGMSLLDFL